MCELSSILDRALKGIQVVCGSIAESFICAPGPRNNTQVRHTFENKFYIWLSPSLLTYSLDKFLIFYTYNLEHLLCVAVYTLKKMTVLIIIDCLRLNTCKNTKFFEILLHYSFYSLNILLIFCTYIYYILFYVIINSNCY